MCLGEWNSRLYKQSPPKTNLVSEVQRVYNRDIAAFASPKGTLDCVAAFSYTDFRGDLDHQQ
jgi:non-heme chloroperoxidase